MLRVFSLQWVRAACCAWAVLLTQSCCGKASKNVPVWRWGSASLTSTRHWNRYEISSETSDSSQFSRLEFIMTEFKSTAEVTLTNWFQISIVKHCIMSLFWISPKSGLLSYFTLWSHLQHDSKEPAGEWFTEDRWVKEITANYDGWYGGASHGDRHRRSL